MNLGFLKKKWQRRLLRFIAGATAAVLIVAFFINLYWSPILARAAKSAVLDGTDSLYRIDFTDADLHVLQGKIVVHNIAIQPDTAIYNQRIKSGTAPDNLYRLHIKKLVLRHIHPFSLYFSRKLDVTEIVLSAPQIDMIHQLNHKRDTVIKDRRTLYQQIAKTLKYIHIGRIGLNDVHFRYEDHSGKRVTHSEIKDMNISATDMLIDSATQYDRLRTLYCRDILAEVNNFSSKTSNGLYSYNMKLLRFSTQTARLDIQNFKLLPLGGDRFFNRSQHDRFTLSIDSVQLNNFDFFSYHKNRILNASSLELHKGEISVFTNYNKPKRDNDKFVTFPNYGIYKLQTDLKLDTVLLDRITVQYAERNKKSLKVGAISFNNTEGRVFNLTTNTAALKKNPVCTIVLNTWLMNKARLNTTFTFNMADASLPYTYNGHLGEMNLPVINPAAMPLAMIKINSGKLNSLDFDIKANRYVSKGKVSMLYHDLKITVLKPDTVHDKLKHMTLMSFFANALIIKHNNPDNANKAHRTYTVNYQRPPDFSFFKTLSRTLIMGIKSCAGYGEQKEQQVKTQMADRAQKKAERKAKRAARQAQKKAGEQENTHRE